MVGQFPISPYYKRLYIPWKRVINRDSSTQIVNVYSTDQGNTWSVPVQVSNRISGISEDTTFGQSFPLSVTGPLGQVYTVWNFGPKKSIGFLNPLMVALHFLIQKSYKHIIPLELPKIYRKGLGIH